MLSDRRDTSQKANSHTHAHRHRCQHMKYLLRRQEIQKIAENGKSLRNVSQRIIINAVNQPQGQHGSQKSDQHPLQHKWRSDKKVCGADIFHDIDFFRANRNADRHGIADQEDADCQQNHDNAQRHISD